MENIFDENLDAKSSKYIKKSKVNFIILITVVISVLVTSLLAVIIIGSINLNVDEGADTDQIDVTKINRISEILEAEFYEEVDMDKLNDGAIHGIVNGLSDPYSQYLTPEEYTSFTGSIDNEYVGIGVQIEVIGQYVSIGEVFQGSPAEKAGLLQGDIFMVVDGEDAVGLTTTELANFVRGEEGTTVVIQVARGSFDNLIEFNVVRGVIELADLEYAMIDEVGYIKINTFSETIYKEFNAAYKDLKSQGMDKLIIDVRNNSGGYLNQVNKIIDMFVDNSKPIYQEESRGVILSQAHGDKAKEDIEIAVIINNGSASASELLAAALKEINGSELIGVSTYGKGVAQTQFAFSDGSFLKYTYAKWLTPNGNWIQDIGVMPTIELEENEEMLYANVNIVEPLKIDTVHFQNTNAQNILNILGYNVRNDGYFDTNTFNAIKDFQSKNNLNTTGIIDGNTATKLNEKLKNYKNDYKNDILISKAIEVLTDE